MSKHGFTLVETLFAVVILATALLLLSNSWSASSLKVRKTQQQFEIAALLERKMTELEIEYRGKSLDEIPDDKSDNFGDEYPQYSWKMESHKLEIPDVSSTLASQSGGADQFMVTVVKQLTDGLSKAIKEVTVTVILAVPKGKPMQYSVTTYFVDFDKDLPLGMPGG